MENTMVKAMTQDYEEPVSVFDAAKYIISELGSVSAMKLHKLLYYAQAWSVVWDERPIFNEKIEAWVSGPVIPKLFKEHRGKYLISASDLSMGDADNMGANQKETIDEVLAYYGDKNSQWLSDLTHSENPWIVAREGVAPEERSNNEITLASMQEYYSSLT